MNSIAAAAPEVAELLASFGIEIAPGGIVVMADIAKAEKAHVHHSTEPVAAAAFAVVSPTFAKGRFPKYQLVDLVTKRPSMDEREATALAAVCGATVSPPYWARSEPFAAQLINVIDAHDLWLFYRRTEQGEHGVRPSDDVQAWRRGYRELPPARQMMCATIMWLYRGHPDKTWLDRLPWRWLAADAIGELRAAGTLEDWGRLVALYPGW